MESLDKETLEIIKEEQISPPASMKLNTCKENDSSKYKPCRCTSRQTKCASPQTDEIGMDGLVKEKEELLRSEYDRLLQKKLFLTRERFNFILQNEQLRSSYMLREAHRDRQEKIKALHSQLECKNLAALMYVLCSERTRSKLEKLRLIEDYTAYINRLQDLLTEGQDLILNLSRGYKTAARVDHEWREKMKKVVGEFMKFVYHFTGGPEEANQFFFDMPKLLKTETPIVDDPNEDPCEAEETLDEESLIFEIEEPKSWWDSLEDDDRPFVMFGDMADFKPPQRRQVLNTVKAKKTAPKIWKSYVFHDMVLKRSCENVNEIKDVYPAPPHQKQLSVISDQSPLEVNNNKNDKGVSKLSISSQRQATASLEYRNNDMGSLLKIITSTGVKTKLNSDKSALLGAKDSIEIHSTTRLKHMNTKNDTKNYKERMTIEIKKKDSIGDLQEISQVEDELSEYLPTKKSEKEEKNAQSIDPALLTQLGRVHDSLEIIPNHKPDKDHKINYERYCPVDKCKLLQVDSFINSLPPYMKESPYMQFQQTYEDYETCTPEQIEILKQRLAAKNINAGESDLDETLTKEYEEEGVATQTSLDSILPSCTCTHEPSVHDSNFVFDVRDLLPVKEVIDYVRKECLFDDAIDFHRFKVIGEKAEPETSKPKPAAVKPNIYRQHSLKKILRQHPSLLDIFQANTRC